MKRFLIPIMVLMVAIASCGNPGKGEKAAEVAEQATKAPEVEADSVGYIVKLGDMAPDFTCTLTDGKEVKLSDLKGKVVMLQFTASWCGVCRKEMPFIERDIWLPNKDNKDFVLVGIDREEPLDEVKKFAETTGVTYPLALDSNANVFASYAERKSGITRNILIDRDGRIVKLTRLFNEQEFKELVQAEYDDAKDKPEAFYRSIKHMSEELAMSKDTINQCIEYLTTPSDLATTITPESTAILCSIPVAITGASVLIRGTA